ncbi:hypothetical protein BDV38DRAFT_262075 [Aspergillus pseudotamarii]|uniref:Uncharacterized protein n=1 Tax=Aspergillus pseudotamarii TaxID=132259 RepID=A0A5N6SDX4_ASPPS|nr:uncharacterized protein BDV38DRAFT_262075 [Aspergillus pseudotamarii]KAE8132137.1 hypothetical protein BDV38DRAFT_262075 [Aspergillus pseudotamarii]
MYVVCTFFTYAPADCILIDYTINMVVVNMNKFLLLILQSTLSIKLSQYPTFPTTPIPAASLQSIRDLQATS